MAYEALYTRGRPKDLSQLVGQEHISGALTKAILSNRLSHAYLLIGTRGTGKTSTARLLAKAMNCEKVLAGDVSTAKDIPCNKCPSCKSIDSSPDNIEFDAASNRSVDDVSRLLSTAYLAPVQSHVKTFIIDEVHMLSNEAINSILKLIEEPPPNVAFFLATTEINKVPMTIRSRCQVLNFRLIPQETIVNYITRLAARLNVTLEYRAAEKIARLAQGSMRDALTYLDQCYAMADNKISLDDVNQTLGLVSDADLDEIISAVQSQSRAEVGRAIGNAFKSGLSSISIAEALITRLRDIEFENLTGHGNFPGLDSFVDVLRKAILEMQGSGVPDIILEMALMKFASPNIIYAPVQPLEKTEPAAPPVIQKTETAAPPIDDEKKFYAAVGKLGKSAEMAITGVVPEKISNEVFRLIFSSSVKLKTFNRSYRGGLEKLLAQEFGRQITIETVVDENSSAPKPGTANEQHKNFLENAKTAFGADGYEKI